MSSDVAARPHRRTWGTGATTWTHVRLALALAWLVLTVAAVATGQRQTSYEDLQTAIADGAVPRSASPGTCPQGPQGQRWWR